MESKNKSDVLIIIAVKTLPEVFFLCCRNSFHGHLQSLNILLAGNAKFK